jgi:hypothetical protein
MGYNPKLCLF